MKQDTCMECGANIIKIRGIGWVHETNLVLAASGGLAHKAIHISQLPEQINETLKKPLQKTEGPPLTKA